MIYDVMRYNEKVGTLERIDTGSRIELSMQCPDLSKVSWPLRIRFDGRNLIGTDDVMWWILDRIVPETREGVLDDLRAIGIPYYDPWLILVSANGISMNDQMWVKFNPDATYESTHAWRLQ